MRVDRAEGGPGERDHLGRGVELHRARAQRDHPVAQAVVAGGEAVQVPHHRVLGAMRFEHFVFEDRGPSGLDGHGLVGPRRFDFGVFDAEGGEQPRERGRRGGLVHRDAEAAVGVAAEVDAGGGGSVEGVRVRRPERHRVEEAPFLGQRALLRNAVLAQGGRESGRQAADPTGDRPEPVRSVPHGVEASDVREQRLGRADVARRPVALDVLLARLDRHPQRRVAAGVAGDTDDPARHFSGQLFLGREVGRVRAAVAHRHAEALGRANRDVGPQRTRRIEQHERERVGGGDEQAAVFVGASGELLDLRGGADAAVRVGVLDQDARDIAGGECVGGVRGRVAGDEVDAEAAGAGPQHRERLRVAGGVGEEAGLAAARLPVAHRHRLRRGRRLVQQRSVRDGQPGEVADQRLEVEQALQPALRNLRLVRRVGRVPERVLQHVPQDDRRRVRAVVAAADHRRAHHVAVGDAADPREGFRLGQRRRVGQLQLPVQPDPTRHHGIDQLVDRRHAHRVEHRHRVCLRLPVVPGREGGVGRRNGGRSGGGVGHGRAYGSG